MPEVSFLLSNDFGARWSGPAVRATRVSTMRSLLLRNESLSSHHQRGVKLVGMSLVIGDGLFSRALLSSMSCSLLCRLSNKF